MTNGCWINGLCNRMCLCIIWIVMLYVGHAYKIFFIFQNLSKIIVFLGWWLSILRLMLWRLIKIFLNWGYNLVNLKTIILLLKIVLRCSIWMIRICLVIVDNFINLWRLCDQLRLFLIICAILREKLCWRSNWAWWSLGIEKSLLIDDFWVVVQLKYISFCH